MKLYVYCLVDSLDTPSDSLKGVSSSKVRLSRSGDFSLLVSDFAGDVVRVTRDNVLAHDTVVRSVLEQTTPLPFRFGTLVTEQQLENYVNTRRAALQAKLEMVGGCVEMSVKIIGHANSEEEPHHDQVQVRPGTAFLAQKRREILGFESRTAQAKEIACSLEGRLAEFVKETRIETNPTDKMLLAAAHLVERGSVQNYRNQLAEAREERPELHFLVSGPWAPYSFANIDLEFKTQFGVS